MERDERIGLRLSIAMHVALLAAFRTGDGSAEQNAQTTPVELVVLPAQSPEPEGEQLTDATDDRSEEHTSELQSLMRISYAVFCLKKKNTYKNKKQTIHIRYTKQ